MNDYSGIQLHSRGSLYPYTIVTLEVDGVLYEQAWHPSGWRGNRHQWDNNGATNAMEKAEIDIENRFFELLRAA